MAEQKNPTPKQNQPGPSFPLPFFLPLLKVQPDLTTLTKVYLSSSVTNFCLVAECLSADQLHTKAREGVDSLKLICLLLSSVGRKKDVQTDG